MVEAEALLNDRTITCASSDVRDPEPITPSHLLHGRRISMLLHSTVHDDELCDPNFGDVSEIRCKAKAQALIIKHFGNRWRKEYLTALRESHKTTGVDPQ